MISLTDTNARLASIWTRITCIQIYIIKIDTYLDTLVTYTVSYLLLPPLNPREVLENIKRGMAQHPQVALPNDPY